MITLSDQAKQEFEQTLFERMSQVMDSGTALKLVMFDTLLRKHGEASANYFDSDWDQLSTDEIYNRSAVFEKLDKELKTSAEKLKKENLSPLLFQGLDERGKKTIKWLVQERYL